MYTIIVSEEEIGNEVLVKVVMALDERYPQPFISLSDNKSKVMNTEGLLIGRILEHKNELDKIIKLEK